MSHASVIVAVTPAAIQQLGSVENALAEQMYPFDENDECFRDGSRWDWYQIGGRFTGTLSGYDPIQDPANYEPCRFCGATGKRKDIEVADGCNVCHGSGKALKYGFAEHGGDILQVKALKLNEIQKRKRASAKRTYAKAQADAKKKGMDSATLQLIYDVDPAAESEEQYLARCCDGVVVSAYAFLRERHWHEPERMGWFGMSAKTECEIAHPNASVEEMVRRCKYRDPETGAVVVCWNEPYEVWAKQFYSRFIEPLPQDTYLVNVDYHV